MLQDCEKMLKLSYNFAKSATTLQNVATSIFLHFAVALSGRRPEKRAAE